MGSLPPDGRLSSLHTYIPCRERQIAQLVGLLTQPSVASPSNVVVYGVPATGKSFTICAILNAIDTPAVVINSHECITTRHLLERTISATKEALKGQSNREEVDIRDGRCDSISAFVVELQHLLEGRGKFILAFDGIDDQREAAPTLLPAIARLGEIVGLCTMTLRFSILTVYSYPI